MLDMPVDRSISAFKRRSGYIGIEQDEPGNVTLV
jgi:hypothetical protein